MIQSINQTISKKNDQLPTLMKSTQMGERKLMDARPGLRLTYKYQIERGKKGRKSSKNRTLKCRKQKQTF